MIKRTLQVFPSPCCVTGAVIAIFSLPPEEAIDVKIVHLQQRLAQLPRK